MVIAAALAGILVGVVQASFFEWAFHRYWLHRPWQPKGVFTAHTLVHHQLCKFEDTFHVEHAEQHEALHFQWWGGLLLMVINITPWLLIGRFLVPQLPWVPFVVSVASAFFVYYLLYESMHYLMHKPRVGWLERSRAFSFLKHHHQIHHVYMDKNLNVLLPLADWLFGSLVLEAEMPKITPPGAMTLARRHSKWAHKGRVDDATGPAAGESVDLPDNANSREPV